MSRRTHWAIRVASVTVLLMLQFVSSCYKRDTGYGNPDYPPEPPYTEVISDAASEG